MLRAPRLRLPIVPGMLVDPGCGLGVAWMGPKICGHLYVSVHFAFVVFPLAVLQAAPIS